MKLKIIYFLIHWCAYTHAERCACQEECQCAAEEDTSWKPFIPDYEMWKHVYNTPHHGLQQTKLVK